MDLVARLYALCNRTRYSMEFAQTQIAVGRRQEVQHAAASHEALFLTLITGVLVAFSILMIYSTTALQSQELLGSEVAMLSRHLVYCGMGCFVFFFASRLNLDILRKYSLVLVVLSFVLLLCLFVPGIGETSGGAMRWVRFGPLRFQPGEIGKLGIVAYISTYIGRHHSKMGTFSAGIIRPFLIVASFSFLLLLQPDFGTTVVLFLVVFFQLLTLVRFRYLFMLGGAGLLAVMMLVATSPYRMKRLTSFTDPFSDPSKSGYQLIQSLIAVGAGGLTGSGLGAGKQKLYYLPAAHTDFIFAVIAEELGLLGCVAVISLFLAFAYFGFRVSKRLVDDPYRCALALGCTLLIVVPAALNIGVVTGLLPTKGLVLPFLAYGGTAMVVNLFTVGILVGLAKHN